MKHSSTKDLAQALFEEAGDALFLFDPDTDVVQDVNPMAERLSGFSRAELLRFESSYLFRFGPADAKENADSRPGVAGKRRLQHAASNTGIFHAQDGFFLRSRQDGVWVQDLGSTNGTYLNGTRLDGPRRLARGDIVRVGETDLRYEQ